ncbi:hypothetical protein QBC38DRAFT_526748 [Podospora fimiseda]|uniref:LysM domain-containing protein n=1 Tax=Podospora fimiseda TaxID=252190 RepID=A0AAN7BE71_9PEZI|nr:hypothetical protein QBC38DRAFT_526748 [Podospora fimiseda]
MLLILNFFTLRISLSLAFSVIAYTCLFHVTGAVRFITTETALCVSSFRPGFFYTEKFLSKACIDGCENGLLAYERAVVAACAHDTWQGYDEDGPGGEQLGTIPSLLRYLYSVICLRDNGRWCNALAGVAAQAADPGSLIQGPIGLIDGVPSPCDMCFIKSLRIQVSVSYFDGPALVDALIYENKTSSCGIKNMPRTTSALGITLRGRPTLPTSAPYNKLAAWCHDFPTSGLLCIVNKRKITIVPPNATCSATAASENITEVLLKFWNPVLNAGCYNIGKLEGHQLCFSPPGPIYVDPHPIDLAPTSASTPAPVPTNLANGTSTHCGRYYEVQPDEYCNLLAIRLRISLADFLFLNPAFDANCTNLFAYESYCIQPVGDIATYLGQPGASPTSLAPSIPFIPPSPILPTVTVAFPAPANTQAPKDGQLPISPGTRQDCYRYFNGFSFQDARDLAGTTCINQCQRAAAILTIDWGNMQFWNSDLASIKSPACSFNPAYRYCRQLIPSPSQTPEPPPPDHELPAREGAISTCMRYADVPGDWECKDVLLNYNLTIAQFFKYNLPVNADCSGLWPNMTYCIRAPGYPDRDDDSNISSTASPSTSVTATSTSLGPPGPTHAGQPANCNLWHVVVSGDTCATVPAKYGITIAQFLDWNPAVSTDCTINFWLGEAYCVGISGKQAVPVVPTPVQAGNAVSGCKKYAQAQTGDSCSDFAVRNGLSLAKLYAWNRVLGTDGSGCKTSFWAMYWYCVGVA